MWGEWTFSGGNFPGGEGMSEFLASVVETPPFPPVEKTLFPPSQKKVKYFKLPISLSPPQR